MVLGFTSLELHGHHLDGSELLYQPFVVVPGSLVLGVGIESILKHLKVTFDSVDRDGV